MMYIASVLPLAVEVFLMRPLDAFRHSLFNLERKFFLKSWKNGIQLKNFVVDGTSKTVS